jgi:CspA family cold shock protein
LFLTFYKLIAVYLQNINYYNTNTMSKGTVKFFNDSKGFGFITEDDNNKEHFVHISGLIDEIREGDAVEFDLQEGKKGLNAVNVKVI